MKLLASSGCTTVILILAISPIVDAEPTADAVQDLALCANGTCQAGEFFDQRIGRCGPCPPDTYMDVGDHNCSSCKPCTPVDAAADQETLVTPCTRQTDAVIGCQPGRYMVRGRVDLFTVTSCHLCGDCGEEGEEVLRECGGFDNVACSSGADSEPGPYTILIFVTVIAILILVVICVMKLKLSLSLAGSLRGHFQVKPYRERPTYSNV